MKYFSVFLLFIAFSAQSKVFINIESAHVKKSTLALSPFVITSPSNSNEKKLASLMEDLLNKNLKFSSYFQILSSGAFIENPATLSPEPYPKSSQGFRWKNWKLIGTDFLLFNRLTFQNKELILEVSFYNINLEKKVFQKKYQASFKQVEKIIHRLSNDIVKALSGKKGIFETKILSVRNISKNQKELFTMDWNGKNLKRLTFHRSIVLSPLWAPDGKSVAYSTFVYNKKLKKRQNVIFLYDLKTQLIRLLSNRNGANLGAAFYPDGKSLLITLGVGKGIMDIFKFQVSKNQIEALTFGPSSAIHVEPSIHPRNKNIAFSSNQKGKVHIFTMNPRGKGQKQLTFAGHYNSSPSWAPFENKLAFSGKAGGRFDIFTIRGDGTNLKRITKLRRKNGTFANSESPSFSPDGRFVVFTSDLSGTYQLYVMNLDDRSIERITFDNYNYKAPKWSPYLQTF